MLAHLIQIAEWVTDIAFPGVSLIRTCHVLSPSPHREGCAFPRFQPCGSRWFWLSPRGAIKCVACAAPADLSLVEAWVLASARDGRGRGRLAHPRRDSFAAASRYEPTAMSKLQPRLAM